MFALIRKVPPERWFVYAALLAGVFFVAERAAAGVPLFEAFLSGCGAAAAVMLLGGLAQRLHAGDRLQSVQLPGGAGAGFEKREAVEAVRATVDDVTASLSVRMDDLAAAQVDLRERLARVESVLDGR